MTTTLNKIKQKTDKIMRTQSIICHYLLAVAVLSVASAAVSTSRATPPKIHPDFATDVIQTEKQNVGYFYTTGNGAQTCCHTKRMDMPFTCKLQMEYRTGAVREQGSKNRTRQGNVVAWYQDVMKEMAVVPAAAGSKHAWACAAYCPISDLEEFESLVAIGDCGPMPEECKNKNAPHDAGSAIISQARPYNNVSRKVENWAWTKTILIVPVERNSMFIDISNQSNPVPFVFRSQLAPGGGQTQAEQNLSYVNWEPVDFDKDRSFDIDPESIKQCPLNPGGCSSERRQRRSLLEAYGLAGSKAKEEEAAATAHMHADYAAASPTNISFPPDWQAFSETEQIEGTGSTVAQNGDLCCDWNAPSCLVGYTQRTAFHWFDYTHNRERVEDIGTGEIHVYDFNTHKDLRVHNVAGVDTCVEYCPLPHIDHMPKFPFPSDDKVIDMGETSWHGKPAHQYRWYDYLLNHSIPIQTYNLYLDLSNRSNPIPLEKDEDVTPFNSTRLLRTRTRWSQFKAGPVPAKLFHIAAADTCPRAKSCAQAYSDRLNA